MNPKGSFENVRFGIKDFEYRGPLHVSLLGLIYPFAAQNFEIYRQSLNLWERCFFFGENKKDRVL